MGARMQEPARAIHAANVAASVRMLAAAAEGSHLYETPGVLASIVPSAPDDPIANVVAVRDVSRWAREIDGVHAAYERAGVRRWAVWIESASGSAVKSLAKHAYERFDLHAMSLDLTVFEPGSLSADPLVITAEEQMRAVARVNALAQDGGAELVHALVVRPDDPAVRTYGAREGTRAVSVLITIDVPIVDGTYDCAIGFVATHPEKRRRGYARRLLTVALSEARARGCLTASLQATEAGARVYETLGFKTQGTYERFIGGKR